MHHQGFPISRTHSNYMNTISLAEPPITSATSVTMTHKSFAILNNINSISLLSLSPLPPLLGCFFFFFFFFFFQLAKGNSVRYDHGKSCSEPLDTWKTAFVWAFNDTTGIRTSSARSYKRPCVLLCLWQRASRPAPFMEANLPSGPLAGPVVSFLCLFSGQLNPSSLNDERLLKAFFYYKPCAVLYDSSSSWPWQIWWRLLEPR